MDIWHYGKQVTRLSELYYLAKEKKAVISKGRCFSHKSTPAAFIINMNGSQILQLFNAGLFVYQTKEQVKNIKA